MEKKYRYNIGLSGEGYTCGTIDLTEKGAATVAYAMNKDNWQHITYDDGNNCWIDIDHPQEIED